MSVSYRLVRAIITLLFRVICRFEVVGRENVPSSGPLIMAMNHIDTLDSPAVMVAIPRGITVFAARKWARRPKGWLLRFVGAIFVNRGEVDRQALREALKVLQGGGMLGMAPEGTRSATHELQPARAGVAYLAHLSQAPILPVAVTGVEHVIPSFRRLRRAQVRVSIGQPFRLPTVERPKSEDLLPQADAAMRRIAALLPREYQGVYAQGAAAFQHRPVPQG